MALTAENKSTSSASGSATDLHILPLDGLRGFAAFIVLVSHFSNMALSGVDMDALIASPSALFSPGGVQKAAFGVFGSGAGQIGVMMFFALSAFLMFHLYFTRPPTTETQKKFVISRVARILPLYYAVVLIGFIIDQTAPFPFLDLTPADLPAHLLLVGNVSVLWTIPPELAFYLVFLALWRFGHRRPQALYGGLAVFIIVWNLAPNFWASRTFEFFALGGLLHWAYASGVRLGFDRAPGWAAALGFGALFLTILPVVQRSVLGVDLVQSGWQSERVLLTIAILFLLVLNNPFLQRVFSIAPMRFLGKISFSLYLTHLLVLNGLNHAGLLQPNIFSFTLAAGLAIVLSYGTYTAIEAPSRESIRNALSKRSAAATA